MARPVTIAPVIYALIRYTMNAQSVMMTDVADKLGIGTSYLSDKSIYRTFSKFGYGGCYCG